MPEQDAVSMEFHVSRQARDRYQFDEALFSLSGNVLLANFYAAPSRPSKRVRSTPWA